MRNFILHAAFILSSLIIASSVFAEQPRSEEYSFEQFVVFGGQLNDNGNQLRLSRELQGSLKPELLNDLLEGYSIMAGELLDLISALIVFTSLNYTSYLNSHPYIQKVPPIAVAFATYFLSYWLGYTRRIAKTLSPYLANILAGRIHIELLPQMPPPALYGYDGRSTNAVRVWSELLARDNNIDPDNPLKYRNYAFTGSHTNERLSPENIKDRLQFFRFVFGLTESVTTQIIEGDYTSITEVFETLESSKEQMIVKGFPPSLSAQVDLYLTNTRQNLPSAQVVDSNTLYIISYQSNQMIENNNDDSQSPAHDIVNQVRRLYSEANARHFLLYESTLEHTPAAQSLSAPHLSQFKKQIEAFNQNLHTGITRFQYEEGVSINVTFHGGEGLMASIPAELETSGSCLKERSEIPETSRDSYIQLIVSSVTQERVRKLEEERSVRGIGLSHEMMDDSEALSHSYDLLVKAVAGDLFQCRKNSHLYYDSFAFTAAGHELIRQNACLRLKENGYSITCP